MTLQTLEYTLDYSKLEAISLHSWWYWLPSLIPKPSNSAYLALRQNLTHSLVRNKLLRSSGLLKILDY